MKNMFPIFAVLTAVVALQAAPTVSNVAVALAPDGAVQVDYDLSEDAIVTVTFEQGGKTTAILDLKNPLG